MELYGNCIANDSVTPAECLEYKFHWTETHGNFFCFQKNCLNVGVRVNLICYCSQQHATKCVCIIFHLMFEEQHSINLLNCCTHHKQCTFHPMRFGLLTFSADIMSTETQCMCTLLNKCIIFLGGKSDTWARARGVNRSQNLNMLIYVCLNPFFKVGTYHHMDHICIHPSSDSALLICFYSWETSRTRPVLVTLGRLITRPCWGSPSDTCDHNFKARRSYTSPRKWLR